MLFISASHKIVTRFKKREILESINKGVTMTVMTLRPDSREVSKKQKLFGRSVGNLRSIIRKQLTELCIQKEELKNLGIDLFVKTYDCPLSYSYIIVDRKSENPLIKMEEQESSRDPHDRESSLAYRSDNSIFYEQHWKELESIENIVDYDCAKDS